MKLSQSMLISLTFELGQDVLTSILSAPCCAKIRGIVFASSGKCVIVLGLLIFLLLQPGITVL